MLHLTRLTGQPFALNPDLIERAEATPDTVVTLVNGSKYVIRETLDELVGCVQAYRAELVIASRTGTVTPALGSPASTPRARVAARQAAADVNDAAAAANATATVLPLRADRGEL